MSHISGLKDCSLTRQKSGADFSVNPCALPGIFPFLMICTEQILSGQEVLCLYQHYSCTKLALWGLVCFGIFYSFLFFTQQNSVTFKALISQLWYVPKCFSKNCLNTSSACISSNDGKFCLAVGPSFRFMLWSAVQNVPGSSGCILTRTLGTEEALEQTSEMLLHPCLSLQCPESSWCCRLKAIKDF